MTIESVGEIYLEGLGGGSTIEARIEWTLKPANYPDEEAEPKNVKVTGWRWAVPNSLNHLKRSWYLPDEMTEKLLYNCVDHQWLMSLGDHWTAPEIGQTQKA